MGKCSAGDEAAPLLMPRGQSRLASGTVATHKFSQGLKAGVRNELQSWLCQPNSVAVHVAA